ncbi:MAG: hypothetical protein GY765_08140, partial [bacterium]|nr:hypothetical protein [bacterium]
MTGQNELGAKIAKLVQAAEEMKEQDFRVLMEELLKDSDQDDQQLLIPYLTSQNVAPSIRGNLIRMVGYLQNSIFIIPLKNIIDKEANVRLKQEAVIAVAKFNDRRALNILNTALQNLNNPMLSSIINS